MNTRDIHYYNINEMIRTLTRGRTITKQVVSQLSDDSAFEVFTLTVNREQLLVVMFSSQDSHVARFTQGPLAWSVDTGDIGTMTPVKETPAATAIAIVLRENGSERESERSMIDLP